MPVQASYGLSKVGKYFRRWTISYITLLVLKPKKGKEHNFPWRNCWIPFTLLAMLTRFPLSVLISLSLTLRYLACVCVFVCWDLVVSSLRLRRIYDEKRSTGFAMSLVAALLCRYVFFLVFIVFALVLLVSG
jgi:hypothetical protein